MRIQWLTLALFDMKHADNHIRGDNPAAAEKVAGRIEAVISHLARHPELGREGRRSGTRELTLPDLPYRIVYRIRGDSVQILRVYHASRKWPDPH